MNYYSASEIFRNGEPTGLYHFTKMKNGVVAPVGNCASDCPGHKTPEEAELHFREYMLEGVAFEENVYPKYVNCMARSCKEMTRDCAGHWIYHYPLCKKHFNKESYNAQLPKTFEGMKSSY